jgi:hypothetical protein
MVFLSGNRICAGFFIVCIAVEDSIIKRGGPYNITQINIHMDSTIAGQ